VDTGVSLAAESSGVAAASLTLFKLARFAEGFASGGGASRVALAALATVAGAARAAAALVGFFAGLATLATDDLLAEVDDWVSTLASIALLVGSTEPFDPTVSFPVAFFPPAVPPVVFAIANLASLSRLGSSPFFDRPSLVAFPF
jgi:hypothetical protein